MKQSDEKIPALPITVNRIETQKKNGFRYSLFSEEGFIVGISDSTLTNLDLRKGSVIDQALFGKILENEENWSIREYLIRLLGRRDHASFELKLKGMKKGYSSEILDQIISELEDKGYINNESFARKFAKDKFEFRKWGKSKIRTELLSKKIPPAVIEQTLSEVIDEDQEVIKIRELINKKKASLLRTEKEKRKKKIFDFLVRKGYDSTVILNQMDHLIGQLSK